MGALRDFSDAVDSIQNDMVSEILGKEVKVEKTDGPGPIRKLSSAFVSGFYATRNIHRAQFGPNGIHTGPGFGCPAPQHDENGMSL